MLQRIGVIVLLSIAFNSQSFAVLVSADHSTFGPDTITRDTDQGLDFLDITLSVNLSISDVSSQFGIGGAYEGFRYATAAEAISLINNSGFSPLAAVEEFVIGNTGSDQLSSFISLVGVTFSTGVLQTAVGFTSDTFTSATDGLQYRIVQPVDVLAPYENDYVSATGSSAGTGYTDRGSWLVQSSPVSVPEPPAFLYLSAIGAGSGFVGWIRKACLVAN